MISPLHSDFIPLDIRLAIILNSPDESPFLSSSLLFRDRIWHASRSRCFGGGDGGGGVAEVNRRTARGGGGNRERIKRGLECVFARRAGLEKTFFDLHQLISEA